jgi:hypothetical protein
VGRRGWSSSRGERKVRRLGLWLLILVVFAGKCREVGERLTSHEVEIEWRWWI